MSDKEKKNLEQVVEEAETSDTAVEEVQLAADEVLGKLAEAKKNAATHVAELKSIVSHLDAAQRGHTPKPVAIQYHKTEPSSD